MNVKGAMGGGKIDMPDEWNHLVVDRAYEDISAGGVYC